MPELPRVVDLSTFESEVASPYRDAYREIDGKMRLHTSEDGPLERALEANKAKLSARDGELETAKAESVRLAEELTKATGNANAAKFSKSGEEWDAAVKAEADSRLAADRATFAAEKEAFDKAKTAADMATKSAELESSLRAAATKTSPYPSAVETLATLSRAAGFSQVDGQGVPVAIGDDGSPVRTPAGSLLTYDHFIAELRDPKGRDMGYLWPGKAGTGAHTTTAARAGRTAGGSIQDMTPQQKAEMIGRDGLEAFESQIVAGLAAAKGAN